MGHGPPEPISSVLSTNNKFIIIITTIIIMVPRSLLRNAPHPSGVLRAVKAVPKHGSPEQDKNKEERWVVSFGLFFFASVRIPSAQQQKHRIVAYSQRCRGWKRDAASHESKRLRDGGRLQQTIWNDSFPRRVDKAGPAPSLVGQSVRVGS